MQVVEEASRKVLELDIQVEEIVEACIYKLAIEVCDAEIEITKI